MTTLTKVVLDVDTIPRLDLDFMNNTHFEEVEMVKSLGSLIDNYQQNENSNPALTQALDQWLEHTQAHFCRENELMIDIGFPMYAMHSGEHSRVLEDMKDRFAFWKQAHDIDLLAQYVFIDWPLWFEAHVNSMDMITARFAAMNGYQQD
jgi:hemerythrin